MTLTRMSRLLSDSKQQIGHLMCMSSNIYLAFLVEDFIDAVYIAIAGTSPAGPPCRLLGSLR